LSKKRTASDLRPLRVQRRSASANRHSTPNFDHSLQFTLPPRQSRATLPHVPLANQPATLLPRILPLRSRH